MRELLIRKNWSARRLAPGDFTDLRVLEERRAHLAKVQADYEARRAARDPREKTRLLQEAQARERRLLPGSGATEQEKADIALARKVAVGAASAAWPGPVEQTQTIANPPTKDYQP